MAGSFVGGAFLEAKLGEVFGVLHDTVKNVGSKVLTFKCFFKNFESNLDLLAPVVEEVKEKLDCPEQETRSLIKKMKDVKQLNVLRYRRYEQILPHLHQQTNEFG